MTQKLLLGAALGAALLLAWVATWRFALAPDGYVGYDLVAYLNAASRLISTGSPYSGEVLNGPVANIPANVPIGYFYPPLLAQLFVPLVDIPYRTIASAWIVLQAAAALVVFPRLLPSGVGSRVAVAALVALTSQPFHSALLGGNVSGWLAIGVGVMLLRPAAASGSIAAIVTALKLTPIPLFLVALAARRSRLASLATGGVVFAISFALSPRAWIDFASALPNIFRNEMSPLGSNLSPARALADIGLSGLGGMVGMGIASGFLIWAVVCAWKDGDLTPRVVTSAAAAATFASSTLWDHYLAVLVPLTLYWWPRVDARRQIGITAISGILAGMWLGLEAEVAFRLVATMAVVALFVILSSAREGSRGRWAQSDRTISIGPATATD